MRMTFGGGPEDVYLVEDEDHDLRGGGGATVLFYTAETGSTRILDLLDINLSPITSITTSNGTDGRAPGQIAPFYGPNEVYEMWATANGSPRFLLQASNLGSELGPIRDQYQQHSAQSNGHGTRLQDLQNVNPTSVTAATNGQALVYDSASQLWVAGAAVGGGGGSGDATLAGTQTFTGSKTFTGGLVARPPSTITQARILQALSGQTSAVEEWRDSTGAARAWMSSDFRLRVPNLGRSITFAKAGALATGSGTFRWYNDTTVPLDFLSVRITIGTASTSGTPTVDVNVNGTSIYGTQSARPTIAVGALTSGKNVGFTTATLAVGGYLTADIDVAGTGAADLIVQIDLG